MGISRVLLIVLLVVMAVVLFEALRLGVNLWQARHLAAESRAFERRAPDADRHLLVVGDSTAVGTGATSPRDSVAGRLAARFPGLAVVNMARDGARMVDVVGQLEAAPERSYDAVLIQAGGNDILGFTPLKRLRRDAVGAMERARRRASCVVMMSTGDVGTAPAFPAPVGWLLSARTQAVRNVLITAAGETGIGYVDLYRPPAEDPFLRDPGRYYARDGLHPSAAGYDLWLEQLLANSDLGDGLAAAGSGSGGCGPG